MSRSERLLELLQALRRYCLPASGKKLAQELGISIRTRYRDIASLQAQGAMIEGQAGVGYILRPGFMLPPLNFRTGRISSMSGLDLPYPRSKQSLLKEWRTTQGISPAVTANAGN